MVTADVLQEPGTTDILMTAGFLPRITRPASALGFADWSLTAGGTPMSTSAKNGAERDDRTLDMRYRHPLGVQLPGSDHRQRPLKLLRHLPAHRDLAGGVEIREHPGDPFQINRLRPRHLAPGSKPTEMALNIRIAPMYIAPFIGSAGRSPSSI